jgi:hypothetical protein
MKENHLKVMIFEKRPYLGRDLTMAVRVCRWKRTSQNSSLVKREKEQ